MLLDDGVITICRLENIQERGRMPVNKLVKVNKFWFGERTIGYNRQYMARGVDEQIDMLVRIRQDRSIVIGMYAIVGESLQFRITNVQHILDDDNELRFTDLTLERLNDNYDIAGKAEKDRKSSC